MSASASRTLSLKFLRSWLERTWAFCLSSLSHTSSGNVPSSIGGRRALIIDRIVFLLVSDGSHGSSDVSKAKGRRAWGESMVEVLTGSSLSQLCLDVRRAVVSSPFTVASVIETLPASSPWLTLPFPTPHALQWILLRNVYVVGLRKTSEGLAWLYVDSSRRSDTVKTLAPGR